MPLYEYVVIPILYRQGLPACPTCFCAWLGNPFPSVRSALVWQVAPLRCLKQCEEKWTNLWTWTFETYIKGGGTQQETHTHTQTHTDELKIANVKNHFYLNTFCSHGFFREKVDSWPRFWHVLYFFVWSTTIRQFLHQTPNLLNPLRCCEGSTFALPRIHLKGEPGNEIVATCEEVEM